MSFDSDIPPLLVDTSGKTDEEVNIPPTPVTIVTGYLGSGKSTLLKHITSTNTVKKIAVVLNEFGQSSDIERSLTVRNRNSDGIEVEQWVELDNGCMCCTAKDAGVSAIEKLMERQGSFTNIIIETSGVADPAPIANSFWLDDALMARVKLDSVVAVVDCLTIQRSLDDGPLASLQIACADVILINKCDTVNRDEVEAVESRIREINGAAKIIHCSYGRVPTDEILDQDSYSSLSLKDSANFDSVHGTTSLGHAHANHGLATLLVPLPKDHIFNSSDLENFESKLQSILWSKQLNGSSIEVHRAKGKFHYNANNHLCTKIVQGVRETYDITEIPYESDGESKLVFIGRGLASVKDYITDMFIQLA